MGILKLIMVEPQRDRRRTNLLIAEISLRLFLFLKIGCLGPCHTRQFTGNPGNLHEKRAFTSECWATALVGHKMMFEKLICATEAVL